MIRWIVAAVLLALTGAVGEVPPIPAGCATEPRCAHLCSPWDEDLNPWECFDTCMADDDACLEGS